MKLVLDHEFCHNNLVLTPFSRLRQYEIFEFYRLIIEVIVEGLQQIQIPIRPVESGNKLQRQWAAIVYLIKRSSLLEEVFAVRTSLLKLLEDRLIGRKMLRCLITEYKEKYEGDIPLFSQAYDAFDLVADRIGEDATLAMLFCLFETFNPTEAFWDMIFDMCEVEQITDNGIVWKWGVRDDITAYITSLSEDSAYGFFSGYIDHLDKSGSGRVKKDMLNYVEQSKERWSAVANGIEDDFFDDFFKVLLNGEAILLSHIDLSEYDDFTCRFFEERSGEGYVIQGVERGNYFIFLEAIRQQLIHGIGLHCPFWGYSPRRCCSRDNKAILEEIWSCALPTRSCRLWERMGCLAKDGGAHGKRTRKNISG